MYYNKILGGIVGDIIGSTREWENVKTEDFETEHPLAGIAFQRKLEEATFRTGEGKIPVQRFGDLKRAFYKSDVETADSVSNVPEAEANTILAENVCVTYRSTKGLFRKKEEKQAVKNVSFSVKRGKRVEKSQK